MRPKPVGVVFLMFPYAEDDHAVTAAGSEFAGTSCPGPEQDTSELKTPVAPTGRAAVTSRDATDDKSRGGQVDARNWQPSKFRSLASSRGDKSS